MLLLNNHLNMHSQRDVMVKRVNVTLGTYSLKNLEWEDVFVALSNDTTTGSAVHASGKKWRN